MSELKDMDLNYTQFLRVKLVYLVSMIFIPIKQVDGCCGRMASLG